MGAQFENITYSSEISLTLVVDDAARRRRELMRDAETATPMDLASWLNALQKQSSSMLQSRASREHLEAWLEEVDRLLLEENTAGDTAALPAP